MTWAVIIIMALLAFVALAFVLKAPRAGWEVIGAALLLGIAGYALQGRPMQSGAPKAPQQLIQGNPAELVAERKRMAGDQAGAGNSWQVIADALARHGQFADAAGVLLGAVEKEPKNADAWLALGNSLVGHAEGSLSPAALLAYRRAADADPAHPGPPFFLGLALAQSGRLEEGRALWASLLARGEPDAPWRADLQARIGQLDALIAQQKAAETAPR